MNRRHDHLARLSLSLIIIFSVFLIGNSVLFAAETETTVTTESVYTARPSVNGKLHVEGVGLADESGMAVQLRGVSTHGLTWYPEYVNANLFEQIANDWNCNMIRLAMYASIYDSDDREMSYTLMKKGIELAIANDMYVLVDWHMLEKGDPNEEIEPAMDFFARISKEFKGCPNLIFEICNEPNGSADWSDVIRYSDKVIPLIRENCPDSVIVVGTPEYDRNMGDPILRPLQFDNVAYVLHFYAATHQDGQREELQKAIDAGLPIFISECGICEADGDGTINFESAVKWFNILNKYKISYAIWSMSDKDESSAFFRPEFDPAEKITDAGMTTSGLWVRELIRGKDPASIPSPAATVEKPVSAYFRTWVLSSLGERGFTATRAWVSFALISVGVVFVCLLVGLIYRALRKRKRLTYDDVVPPVQKERKRGIFAKFCLLVSIIITIIYLCWRVMFSIPVKAGPFAIAMNIILLFVEVLGFIESLVLYRNLLGRREHPLPEIPDDQWPDVDIFIATYNEPTDLLYKTINGCKHLKYPDKSKVHIWVCDDNRRPQMRELAGKMGVGYFDRPDNSGAKAGNLNHAMSLTSAPYIVTLDADMIVKSDFLLKTIPYFVDVELREASRPEEERLHLGLLQTPQCFYDRDVFQHALYSEKTAPNEQDFFYRTIEPAKTCTNSVIYGGSNTVLSRRALNDIGGFFTGSITEDFATGLLIESAGYISLATPEPLASGQTPHTYKEHIQQRTRWGRGVIVTAKKLKIFSRRNLNLAQKVSYWSSVIYWYSPLKNLIYVISPLLYAAFAVPVLACNWLELLVFWLPMFLMQDVSLRFNSRNTISTKWSGIYETSVMPHLFIPVLKESVGISLSKFKVTDKSRKGATRQRDIRSMIPFLILLGLSVIGIIRIAVIFEPAQTISILILLFWLFRNMYYMIMSLFLIDGRDSDVETVHVRAAEQVIVECDGVRYEGVTTHLTEHSLTVYLDDGYDLKLGTTVDVNVTGSTTSAALSGVIANIKESRNGIARTQTIEIRDFKGNEDEYLQLLYDRIPTLPQTLKRDFGVIPHLWQNIAHRVARTRL
ncbi:cellulose synthase (UDP-forming) [Ruminococcaceae bacterium YRB3002]|nr:cellulose synthase (UDP-forming) [Ruminococcaceae bacterium YRB3002]